MENSLDLNSNIIQISGEDACNMDDFSRGFRRRGARAPSRNSLTGPTSVFAGVSVNFGPARARYSLAYVCTVYK